MGQFGAQRGQQGSVADDVGEGTGKAEAFRDLKKPPDKVVSPHDKALREVEALRRLAVVVRDAYDAVTVQDLEGRILAWNPAAERI